MHILLTGATGLVGGGILTRALKEDQINKVYVVMRGAKDQSAADRFQQLIQDSFPPELRELAKEKFHLVEGDLVEPNLGLSPADLAMIKTSVTHILHCGANTKFTLPIEELRRFNVEGTRQLVKMAKGFGRIERFDFVSTAFVAGNTPGTVRETDLHRDQTFTNNYEQSKYETEMMLETQRDQVEFPISIYRPSIIVGDSRTGYTPHFRVLYWPMRMLDTRGAPIICCNKQAKLDVVPSDYVCDSIMTFALDPEAAGKTWHITAGLGNELLLGTLIKELMDSGSPWAPLAPVWLFRIMERWPIKHLLTRKFWALVEKVRPFLAYMFGNGVTFDAQTSQRYLEASGVAVPKWPDYRDQIFQYARGTNWGAKRKPSYMYIHYGYNPKDQQVSGPASIRVNLQPRPAPEQTT